MAWLPIEFDTPEKPEVQRMAEALRREPEEILGRVILVWRWAQEQTPDGRITPGSLGMVDRQARLKGFGVAMQEAKWVSLEGDTLIFPRWDLHNSENAKKRKLNAKRAEKSRAKRDTIAELVAHPSRSERDKVVTPALTTKQNSLDVDDEGARKAVEELRKAKAAWLQRRPEWLKEGIGWITREAATKLAALDLEPDVVQAVYADAKKCRATLTNPAGYVIAQLERAAGGAA